MCVFCRTIFNTDRLTPLSFRLLIRYVCERGARYAIIPRVFSHPDFNLLPPFFFDPIASLPVTGYGTRKSWRPSVSSPPSSYALVLFINDAALLIARGLNLAAYWYELYRLNGERRLQLEPILPPAISHGESSNDSFDKLPSLSLSLSFQFSFREFKYLERFALIYGREMIRNFV